MVTTVEPAPTTSSQRLCLLPSCTLIKVSRFFYSQQTENDKFIKTKVRCWLVMKIVAELGHR